ncbi:MAG: hypothetical protein QOK06_962 [Acidimicrobiaceae bacterium]
MIVRVSADGAVALVEVDDLARFHVEAERGADVDGALATAGAGRLGADGDARITVTWLRSTSRRAGEPAWDDGLEGMLGYAGTKGWLDDDGATIRAHVASL